MNFDQLSIETLTNILKNGGPIAWALVVGAALLLSFVLKIVIAILADRAQRFTKLTRGDWDDVIVECLRKTGAITIFVWATHLLLPLTHPPANLSKISKVTVVIVSCLQVIQWGICAITIWRNDLLKRKADTQSSLAAISLLGTALKGLLVIAAILVALSNLGVDVGALVAGLGVGGIAVALAAQNVLGDLLASLSIVLDKPFVVGDFIVVGSDNGTVETIGVKTTRVRSLSGEELIFSNKDLLESRVRNFKRMSDRRVVLTFGVTYSTPREKLNEIPNWIQEIVTRDSKLRFDRVHLSSLGESAINYELVFIVLDPDYNAYMNIQQRILLEVIGKFEEEEVEFAFPSRTIYLQGDQLQKQKPGEAKLPPAGERSSGLYGQA